ncbi:MAG TPA: sterol desaturase family protein [Candidatus Gracilibacteria bacterium]
MLEFLTTYKTILLAGAAAIFFALETFRPLIESLPESRGRHIVRNFIFTGFNFLLFGLSYSVALIKVSQYSESHGWGLFYHLDWAFWIETILILLLLDLALYIWHVASHKIPFLWKFHRVHHSDLIIDFSSASRFHIGELVMSAIIRLMLLVLLGVGLAQMVLFEFLVIFCAQFNHSNFRLPRWFEPILRVFIVTPEMHHIHHSQKQIETNSNYCTTISLWDRIFRTFRWRSDIEKIEIGLKAYPKTQSVTFWKIIIMPFKK